MSNAGEMRRAQTDLKRATGHQLVALTLDIHGELVMVTPKDTGFASNNWILSIGAPAEITVPLGGPGAALAALGTVTGLQPIFITNNVEYITALDDGWSPQAPKGFVKITLNKVVKRHANAEIK